MFPGRHARVRVDTGWLPRSGTGVGRMAAFGTAYTLSSLSCTLAVLLAVVAQALAVPSFAGTVLLLLALSAAVMSGTLARALRRLSGAVLTLSGAYLVAYWLPVLLGTRSQTLLSRSGDRLSSVLGSLLGRFQGLVVVLAAVALVAALAATGYARRRRPVRVTA